MAGGSGQRYRLELIKCWVPSDYQIRDTVMTIGETESWRVHAED